MIDTSKHPTLLAAVVAASIGFSDPTPAYGTKDAICDCESRLRTANGLSVFGDQSTEQLMDLVFAVGQYHLVSMALNSFGVQLDEGIQGLPQR